ncbi:MAG TPA: Panacea domain-containing protein [Gemmatimonadales bacterium]|nr:Panacea domain-containing protein [Gemmatimonadales bacterium]
MTQSPGAGVILANAKAGTLLAGSNQAKMLDAVRTPYNLEDMPMRYREDRTTQAAAYLLQLRGGTMSYMKLIKLLYLADRKALADLGRPITFDSYVAMARGPVLSCTLDRITGDPNPTSPTYWRRYISAPTPGYEVRLDRLPEPADLSAADQAILDSVFAEFGHLSRWDVVAHTHTLPEWRDPGTSCAPIQLREILIVLGFNEEEVHAIIGDLEAESLADATLA